MHAALAWDYDDPWSCLEHSQSAHRNLALSGLSLPSFRLFSAVGRSARIRLGAPPEPGDDLLEPFDESPLFRVLMNILRVIDLHNLGRYAEAHPLVRSILASSQGSHPSWRCRNLQCVPSARGVGGSRGRARRGRCRCTRSAAPPATTAPLALRGARLRAPGRLRPARSGAAPRPGSAGRRPAAASGGRVAARCRRSGARPPRRDWNAIVGRATFATRMALGARSSPSRRRWFAARSPRSMGAPASSPVSARAMAGAGSPVARASSKRRRTSTAAASARPQPACRSCAGRRASRAT